jgi:hypothetical protein
LARLPVFTTTIRRWLKAGTVELGTWKPTPAGAPQGGPLSPLLANVALDGMERLFGAEDDQAHYRKPSQRPGRDRGISLIRYADDAVVTAPTRETLSTYVIPKLTTFLAEQGLKLSEAKTRIVHVDEGFDFLGFTVRRYRGVVLTRPQKTKLMRHLRSIADYLRQHRQATASQIIGDLGPVIRGWANYYRHGASKHAFHFGECQGSCRLNYVMIPPIDEAAALAASMSGDANFRLVMSVPRCSLRRRSGARHPRHARARQGALRVAAGGSAPPISCVALRGLGAARSGRESRLTDRTGKQDL